MAKFLQIILVALFVVALCSAEAPSRSRSSRFQVKRNRNRFLARQEEAAVTPYPTADELKPEVPFEEAAAETPEDAPEQLPAQQPDEVYGPPEDEALPAEATDDLAPTADEEEAAAAAAEDEAAVAEEEAASARLTSRRRAAARKSAIRPAKLRKAPVRRAAAAPARLTAPARTARLQLQPQFQQAFAPQPVFYYYAQ